MIARQINAAGLALIKADEGCVLKAYRDSGGMLTIGYGHTGGVHERQTITQAQADALLQADLAWAENAVTTQTRPHLDDNQFSAMVSFVFNVGPKAWQDSNLLRLINAGDYAAVPAELAQWCHVKGQVSRGLQRRRAEEAALWAKP